jgi:hypothetical protein
VHAIVIDYAGTHHKTFKPISPEMIDLWLTDQQNEDLPRGLDREQPLPMLILEARDFNRDLAESRQLNLDVLEPELVRVIDDFHWLVVKAVQFYGLAAQGLGDPVRHREIGLSCAVEAAQQCAKVFKHLGPDWMVRSANGRRRGCAQSPDGGDGDARGDRLKSIVSRWASGSWRRTQSGPQRARCSDPPKPTVRWTLAPAVGRSSQAGSVWRSGTWDRSYALDARHAAAPRERAVAFWRAKTSAASRS